MQDKIQQLKDVFPSLHFYAVEDKKTEEGEVVGFMLRASRREFVFAFHYLSGDEEPYSCDMDCFGWPSAKTHEELRMVVVKLLKQCLTDSVKALTYLEEL